MAAFKVLQKCFVNDHIAEVDDIVQLDDDYPCGDVLEAIVAATEPAVTKK